MPNLTDERDLYEIGPDGKTILRTAGFIKGRAGNIADVTPTNQLQVISGIFGGDLTKVKIDFVRDSGGSENLLVDGSSAPVVFTFDADPTDDIFLSQIRYTAVTTRFDVGADSFMKEAALTNGVLVEITSNGLTSEVANFKISEDLIEFGTPDQFEYSMTTLNDFIIGGIVFGGSIVLKSGTADNIKVTVRDDLIKPSHELFRIKVVGLIS